MKKSILYCIGILLSILFVWPPSTAYATMSLPLVELPQSCSYDDAQSPSLDVATIWILLRDSEKLLVNDSGYFYVIDNDLSHLSVYSQFLDIVDHCNLFISEGIIVATEASSIALKQTAKSYCHELICGNEESTLPTELGLSPSDTKVSLNGGVGSNFEYIIFDGGPDHICAVQSIDALSICENNYQLITEYHESMLILQQTEPTFNAWLATASFWVSQVSPNGPWDYKVSDLYGPYNKMLCTYYNGAYRHFTSEYFGNLNYGYTGSYLFTLDMLHFGSSAVAGFDPADESDWPAIDEGFYLKRES